MDIKKIALVLIAFFSLTTVSFSQINGQLISYADDGVKEIIEQEIEVEPTFLQGYIELNEEPEIVEEEEIFLETDVSPTYRINQIKEVSTYSKSLVASNGADFILSKGGFSLGSSSSEYNDSKTLVKNVRNQFGVHYQIKRFSLSGGVETVYDTTSVSEASRGMYLTPKLNLTDSLSFSVKNKVNQDATKFEPTFGLNYTPKYMQNSNIWLGTGATFRNNILESKNLNLRTNFYLF